MVSATSYLPFVQVTRMLRALLLATVGIQILLPHAWSADDVKLSYFREQVLPVLEQHCFQCHAHAAGKLEGGLALDYRSGWEQGGDRGPSIVPFNADNSLLYQAVQGTHAEVKMPPDGSLTASQREAIRRWIEDGAVDDRSVKPASSTNVHWSLRPLVSPPLPESVATMASDGPIDAYLSRDAAAPIESWPQADRRTLIRRLYVDLLGYLPTYDEVVDFQEDVRVDAVERLVDRLLSSPGYGERWARHWFDTIHFAESHGFEHDVARPNAWVYRDYVIERLNADIAWSDFIREQLAADFFYPDQPHLIAGLGFLGAGTFDISSLTTAPMNFAYLDRDDMVTQTMGAFNSITVQCARCHAHKFDPITQEDYFALQAVFAGVVKGDVPFDTSAQVAQERRQWQSLLKSIQDKQGEVLLAPEWEPSIDDWEQSIRARSTTWRNLRPVKVEATSDARWTVLDDDSMLLSAPYPEITTTTVELSIDGTLDSVTALRVELLPHESLPARGPGAAANGNLHLSEVRCMLIPTDRPSGDDSQAVPLKLVEAMADFEQEGWTAAHAIDNVESTALGIHPQEGKRHSLVVKFAQPVIGDTTTRLRIELVQHHGRAHVIGCMRLAVTDSQQPFSSELAQDVVVALGKQPAERTAAERLSLASAALRELASAKLANLPAQTFVYAAASSVPAGNGTAALAREQPHRIQLLQRGDITKPLREVGPGALTVLGELQARFEFPASAKEASRRAALADWLADSRNCLTWRSIANRVWHYHFGLGLCNTPGDLGRMGAAPTHPELLEWLACQMRDGQSLKQLHRQIVLSKAYSLAATRSSTVQSSDVQPDVGLRLMHDLRGGRYMRLDADAYRDSVLRVSGELDLRRGGPSVQHFSTRPGQQLTPQLNYAEFDWGSEGASRRTVYRFVWRGIADPFMETLDFPDLGTFAARRSESLSALQALATYNNAFVLHNADALAKRASLPNLAISDSGQDSVFSTAEQVDLMFQHVLQRRPSRAELDVVTRLATEYSLPTAARVLLNSNEFLFLD